ncbi:MAG: hypothetical protein ABDH29_08040 [Aquificaceae bacterium]
MGKEKADKVVKVLEDSLSRIEEKAKEQKPILKTEIKEALERTGHEGGVLWRNKSSET